MSHRNVLSRLLAALLAMVILGVGTSRIAADDVPLNAAAGVQYIGAQRCAECHPNQHASFLMTSHSRAAAPTDAAVEPPPASFRHEKSGHTYEVEIADGQLLHRETLQHPTAGELAVTEYPMVTTLGSGAHAKSYLFRDRDFHVESPLTFFTDDQSWAMSPGYDVANHRSFRRTVTVSCVFCHVGMIQQHDNNPYKFEITEHQIGCERCHGPGELHQQRHRNHEHSGGPDPTIVNPRRLPRHLAEAICQQCHCQGVQAVNVSGHHDWDFRPGLPLTDFRVDYQFRRGDQSMRLVGHVEQMQSSQCYIQSETLTCVTCHDPHHPPKISGGPTELSAFYREKCFQCHDDASCGKPNAERVAANGNDCVQCHMPAGETNVAHFALHDHRIAVHQQAADRSTDTASSFEPILDISGLPPQQQQRLQALAKYEIYRRHGGNPKFADFDQAATAELIQLKQAGMVDDEVDAALVWLARVQGEPRIAEQIASELVKRRPDESMPRIVAHHVLADLAFHQGDFSKAVSLYRELDEMHRDGRDAYYLGLSEQNMRNTPQAIAALQRSLKIEPSQVAAHAALHAIYQSLGQSDLAAVHGKAAQLNQQLQQEIKRRATQENVQSSALELLQPE